MASNSEDQQARSPSLRHAGAMVPTRAEPLAMGDSFSDGFGGGLVGPGSPLVPGLTVASLLRFKWLMLATFVVIAGISIPCVWLLNTPKYKARGVVRVAPIVTRIAYRTEENGMVPLYRSYLNTQVSHIRSNRVLNWVLDDPEIQETAWYQNVKQPLLGDPLTPLERLKEILSVSPRRDTELIDVAATTERAGDAQTIVNTVIKKYLRYMDAALSRDSTDRTKTLNLRRAELSKELKGEAASRAIVTRPLDAASPEEYLSQLSRQLATAKAALAQRENELDVAMWERDQLPAAESDDGDETQGDSEDAPEGPPALYTTDAEWRRQHRVLEDVRQSLNIALQRLGDSHPQILALNSNIAHEERMLSERERELDQEDPTALLQAHSTSNRAVTLAPRASDRTSIEWHIGRLKKAMDGDKGLRAQIKVLKDQIVVASALAGELAEKDRKILRKNAEYDVVAERLTQLELESNASGRVSVAGYATKPSRPDRDRRLLLTVMALFAALGGGLGVGYLRSMLDPKIYEASQVQTAVHAPFLGQLPRLPEVAGLLGESTPLVEESMRMVRTALLERLQGGGTSVVLVTSSSSRAGKTSVAILLAKSLARLGKKTLLVEADLHRPSFADRFDRRFDMGLATVLTGSVADSAAIVSTEVGNLDVLPAGVRPDDFNPELLANGVFSKCLRDWRESYDIILIDSPPILPVADARILAGHADGTILVLRASHCRRDETVQAVDDLMAAGGSLLGTVLVGTTVRPGQDYYPGYYSYPKVSAPDEPV